MPSDALNKCKTKPPGPSMPQKQFVHSHRMPIAGHHECLLSIHINPLHNCWSFGYLAHREPKVCSDFSYVPLYSGPKNCCNVCHFSLVELTAPWKQTLKSG